MEGRSTTLHRVVPEEVVETLMAPVEFTKTFRLLVPEKAVPTLAVPKAFPFRATMLSQKTPEALEKKHTALEELGASASTTRRPLWDEPTW
jgi:hypothetical protein